MADSVETSVRFEAHFGRVIPCFADRPPNAYEMLSSAAQASPVGALAAVEGALRFSHAALHGRAARIAGGLQAAGLERGDRVAILARNRWEFVAILIACLRGGYIATPVNTRSSPPELAYILDDCGAAAIFHDGDLTRLLPGGDGRPDLVVDIDGPGFGAMLSGAPGEATPGGEDDTAVILYTSGTTGRPKGATLTHLNIVHSCLHFSRGVKLTAEDRSLLAVPVTHVTGLVANVLTILSVGGASLILPNFDVIEFLKVASTEEMTHTIMVPAMYNLVLMRAKLEEWDLSRWRLGGFGGASMPEATIASLKAALPDLRLINAYGATETASPATMTPLDVSNRPDSVGRVLPCADLKVMDEQGCEAPVGAAGEIWIAGAMVVPGYWRNEAKTAESFCGGYWRSGDVGSIDEGGYVHVHDRVKDMINRGGFKVYSAEVESVLAAHPCVAEAAVIPRADPVLGERVAAVIVLAKDTEPDEESLHAHCKAALSDYKRPDSYIFRKEPLPRNANGKVQKRDLY